MLIPFTNAALRKSTFHFYFPNRNISFLRK
nr:MAG TPA: hypothetical protein [Caudoviricetes sp.]